MSAPDLSAEAAELREIITGLRAEAAELAASLQTMASAVLSMNTVMAIAFAAREEGRREGDTYRAAARAQRARAGFQVVPDGSPPPGGAA